MYYNKQSDTSILSGLRVYGPEFTLDETTTDEEFDGWKWFDTPELAYAHFANPPVEFTPEMQAIYDEAAAAFDSLSLGKQAMWEGVRVAVSSYLLASDISSARLLLETLPATYDGAEADRTAFLNILPE